MGFSKQHLIFWPQLDYTSLCTDYPIESCKITVIPFGSMLPNLYSHRRGLRSRNGPSPFSLICALLLQNLSFIFIVIQKMLCQIIHMFSYDFYYLCYLCNQKGISKHDQEMAQSTNSHLKNHGMKLIDNQVLILREQIVS